MVGARERLNGRENMARRKVKNGEKSPWGQCLTRPVPNGRRRSDFLLVPENVCVFLPNQKAERWRPFGMGLVRHCPQGLFSPFFTFHRAIFFRPFRLSLAPTICPWISEDASVYDNLGEYNQAKELYEKALTIRKKIFGEDHSDVATSYNNLALVYYNLEEYNQAKELHEKALMIRKQIFGEDHKYVERIRSELA